jgi:hydrogenase-4 component F
MTPLPQALLLPALTSTLTPAMVVLMLPLGAALVLALIPNYRIAAWFNIVASLATFAAVTFLVVLRPATVSGLWFVDDLNIVFILLTNMIGFTTAVFSKGYIGHELRTGHLQAEHLRYYHTMYQILMGAMNLALLTSVTGVMWAAIEIATLTTVLMVGVYRSHEALEAAWKYFILSSVGIALALFGTILVYSAAQPVTGNGLPAMTFATLTAHAAQLDPALMNIAFVFILLGYGTKAGLVPIHAWLPDAHAEGPTPVSALLSGLLLNLALYAILRFKLLFVAPHGILAPGTMMITLGLASVIFAGLMLYRRHDIKRFFAYSSIEHIGIATFAFGLGGPVANFAGLLHLSMHSLAKSGLFFAVGHLIRIKGSQKFAKMGGLTSSHPLLGWTFVAAVAAIAGLPPFGLFTSEFLIVTAAVTASPVLAMVLVAGLMISLGALFLCINRVAFGEPKGNLERDGGSLLPVMVHLAVVLAFGVMIPGPIVSWFQHAARLLG